LRSTGLVLAAASFLAAALSLLLMAAEVPSAWASVRTGHAAAAARHDVRDPDGFTHRFQSASGLHPPLVWISGTDPDRREGDIFLDAQNSIQAGPMILSPTGRLIWFDALPNRMAAYDVAVQRYKGQSVLTFFAGGADRILNHRYQTVASVQAGNGYVTGLHEFQITPQGTALVTARARLPADLSSIGGPRNGTVVDDAIQEIDIATGRVLWQWRAYGNVPLSDSYAGKPGQDPYDFFHMNSIQQLPGGNLLISARHTWAVYKIDKLTGRIVWTLGGKHSSFTIGRGAHFEWQHDARMQPDGTITLFDDGAGIYTSERHARALRIRLNYSKRSARVVREYSSKPPLVTYSEGNVQVLSDGNTFVGYGGTPYFVEFGRGGQQLFSGHFKTPPLQFYRAYRFQWWGQPVTPPSISLASTRLYATVYASWNGATGVASWRVLAGRSPTSLAPVGLFRSDGFETAMRVRGVQPYFAVQALGGTGQLLGTSAVLPR
jgi:hypothetical protein